MTNNALKIQGDVQEKTTQQLFISNFPTTVVYYGVTNSTTKTEIFLDGKANQRLVLPPNSTVVINKVCLGYNTTDNAAATGSPEIALGNIASTLGTTTAVTQATVNTVCDIEADDTNDRLTVSITAGDSTDVIEWKVTLTIFCLAKAQPNLARVYDGLS